MAMIDEMYQASGITPENVPDTGAEEPDKVDVAAGEGDTVPFPGCLFYSCFAHENGHCTVLKNNEFTARPCPFYKSRTQMEKDQQNAFDRLLMEGRLDLINRYEEVLVALGIEDPDDAKVPVDNDILKAREKIQAFITELEEEAEEENSAVLDDDEYDFENLMAELTEESADEEEDSGLQ